RLLPADFASVLFPPLALPASEPPAFAFADRLFAEPGFPWTFAAPPDLPEGADACFFSPVCGASPLGLAPAGAAAARVPARATTTNRGTRRGAGCGIPRETECTQPTSSPPPQPPAS